MSSNSNGFAMTIPRLTVDNSVLLIVDVQVKLLAAIPNRAEIVRNAAFLLDVADLLDIPAFASEQYPQGLGPTVNELSSRLPTNIPAKTKFSCTGAANLFDDIRSLKRPSVVLAGMEAHVCIAQTAFDLIDAGYTVFLPVDAVGSRFRVDQEMAVRRLERAGVIPTTVEAVAFEWLGDSQHPQFKSVSKLVIERSKPQ
jgi:nicotinamidase-related amidase